MRIKRRSEAKSPSNDLYVIYFLFLGINPHHKYSPIYAAFMLLWYAFGLAWISLLFNLFSKLLARTKTTFNCELLHQKEKVSSMKTSFFFWPTKVSQTSSRNGETR